MAAKQNRRAEDNCKEAGTEKSIPRPMTDLAYTEQMISQLKTQIANIKDDIKRYNANLIAAHDLLHDFNNHTNHLQHLVRILSRPGDIPRDDLLQASL